MAPGQSLSRSTADVRAFSKVFYTIYQSFAMVDFEVQNESADLDNGNRPAKRRKFYRRRAESDQEDLAQAPQKTIPQQPSLTLDELVTSEGAAPDLCSHDEDARLSVAEILRQRKAAQRKRAGIEFSNSSHGATNPATSQLSNALTTADSIPSAIDAVIDRFTPQTGQVIDVDNKHMMAYIDSELAKRRHGHGAADTLTNGYAHGMAGPGVADLGVQRQPAALGKLHEIDLGPDATLRNIARTEAAKRRLEGGEAEVEEGTGKVRLRKDGKPYRSRRRRNSEDVKRDKLVEEVLREMEIYDEPDDEAPNDDQAADDRIAEQFRREFMDAISSRRQRTGPATTAKPVKGQKVDDKPKGPKLGGSRSARAAMRELQEKAEKAAKK
ncbi:hypothetical protein MMC32_000034 [Xylographa parallela]|nr:hypothetical protein [Xylographa parallela]